MTRVLEFSTESIIPEWETILELQGIPEGARISRQAKDLILTATESLQELAAPIGILKSIECNEFEEILEGEGENAPEHPVKQIYPKSTSMALFAVTLGEPISKKIQESFREKDYPAGYALDSVASLGADNAADLLESHFRESLLQEKTSDHGVLRYSPGYCGWHVSGQRKLFSFLEPSRIGISLNKSCLMHPIKSVSGVILAGPKEIHVFPNSFNFCSSCTTKSCRARIKRLLLD